MSQLSVSAIDDRSGSYRRPPLVGWRMSMKMLYGAARLACTLSAGAFAWIVIDANPAACILAYLLYQLAGKFGEWGAGQ